ncbi:MAG: glycoside hydrolase family 105 protein [Mangrovibacterium sp.]
MNRALIFLSIILFGNSGNFAQKPEDLSVRLAKTIMQRHPDPNTYPWRSWCYPQGFMLMGMAKLFSTTNDSVYYSYILKYADEHVDSLGNLNKFTGNSMDDMMAGSVVVWAYRQTGLEKYRRAAGQIKEAFSDYPRTSDSLFWHGRKTKGEVWVDGVFMGQMFLTNYGKYIEDDKYCFDEAARQLIGICNRLQKGKSGLLYHAWDEDREAKWADPLTGLSPEVWSEGLGWYALILVETLEIFPQDHPRRTELEQICQSLMAGIKKVQDRRTGLWFQVVDKGDRPDNWHDTSGSAMFLYAVKKAVELGLIPERPFEIVVKKAYRGILAKTIISQADGLIDVIDACDGLCVQPSYEAYINYPKKINAKEAVAGVLWASWIMEKSSK